MNNIRAVLKKQGKSQGWLAERSGINRVQLNKIITGATRWPRMQTAIKIGKALGVPVEKLWYC